MAICRKIGTLGISIFLSHSASGAAISSATSDSSVLLAMVDIGTGGSTYLIDLTQTAGLAHDQLNQVGNSFNYSLSGSAQSFISSSSELVWGLFSMNSFASNEYGPFLLETEIGAGYVAHDLGVVTAVDTNSVFTSGSNPNSAKNTQQPALQADVNDWIVAANLQGLGATGELLAADFSLADGYYDPVGAPVVSRLNQMGASFVDFGLNGAIYKMSTNLDTTELHSNYGPSLFDDSVCTGWIGPELSTVCNTSQLTDPRFVDIEEIGFATLSEDSFSIGSPVPIPASAWLFATALAGLMGHRLKSR